MVKTLPHGHSAQLDWESLRRKGGYLHGSDSAISEMRHPLSFGGLSESVIGAKIISLHNFTVSN